MRSFFLSPLDIPAIAQVVRTKTRTEHRERESGPAETGIYLDGVHEVTEFVEDDARQFLEGQILAYGENLDAIYQTSRARRCPDEIVIPRADEQIPVVGEFVAEFTRFVEAIFPLPLKRSIYQIRYFQRGYQGHPEHVDYAPGYTIRKTNETPRCLTAISFSLPISWNGGRAPEFRLVNTDGREIHQTRPGSLVLFGPRIRHSHPATPSLEQSYLWLISQSFYEGVVTEALENAT